VSESEDRKEIRRLRGMIDSPRVEDRAYAQQRLAELRNSPETDVAREALELSAISVVDERRDVDPTVESMKVRWMGLRNPMDGHELDHRFQQWFIDAECLGPQLAGLAPRMVSVANDWLSEYERVSSAASADDQPRLERFDTWTGLVDGHPAVAGVLSNVLAKGERLKKRRLLSIRKRGLEMAIDRGDLEAARSELREIASLPDLPAEDIASIEEKFRELEQHKAEIDAWRSEVAGAPRDWNDIVRMHEVWAKGRRLVQLRGMPAEWINRITGELDILQSLAGAFVERSAAACDSLDAVRSAAETAGAASRGHLPLDTSWIDSLALAMVAAIERAIERVDSPETLRRLAAEVEEIGQLLPAIRGLRVNEALRRVEEILVAWSALDSEEIPHLPDGIVLPARLAERMEAARRLAQRIDAAEAMMNRGSTTAERIVACGEAIATLDLILDDAGRPASASALRQIVLSRLELLKLDEAIERWDVGPLAAARQSGRVYEAPYGVLLQALPLFEQLADLRGHPFAAIADLGAAGIWWRSWQKREAELPSQRPESLRRALRVVRVEAAVVARQLVNGHLGRVTTPDEDRAAWTALAALSADLGLADDLFSLGQRRDVHIALAAARVTGPRQLASLLRDHWGTVARYLPWYDTVLSDAFQRAWNESDDQALEALRTVPLPETLGPDRDRFRQWLEWLDIERSLSADVVPERARRLHTYVQRNGGSSLSVARRLARLMERWRTNGDRPALAWAFRVFAQVDPPLFPGGDPLSAMTRQSEWELAAIVETCLKAEVIDAAFLEKAFGALARIEQGWSRLEQMLLEAAARQEDGWPSPPPALQETRRLLGSFRFVADHLERWTHSDIRMLGNECDTVRSVLLQDLSAYPASEVFGRVLRRVEPLTRMSGQQQHLRDACKREAFAEAARYLEAIIGILLAAQPEGSHTLAVVQDEYWTVLPRLAGDVLPPDSGGGLEALQRRLVAMHENEAVFQRAIEDLWREQPNVGAAGEFSAAKWREYLALYPTVPPTSLQVRKMFDDFAARATQQVIIRKGREFLPQWLQTYVDKLSRGVSPW